MTCLMSAVLRFIRLCDTSGKVEKFQNVAAKSKKILMAAIARAWQSDRDNLFDPPGTLRHYDDAVTHVDCFVDVVRNEEHGGAAGLPKTKHFILHAHAGKSIEGAERFIEKQNFGMIDEGPSQGNALCHSSGKMVWIGIGESLQANESHEIIHFMSLFLQDMSRNETCLDIAANSQPRKQIRILKNQSTFRARRSDRFGTNREFARIRNL